MTCLSVTKYTLQTVSFRIVLAGLHSYSLCASQIPVSTKLNLN